LPGTLGNLFDNDSDNDAVTPLGPTSPRPPPPKDDSEILPPPLPSLPEQVDDFGWTLVAAIRDFRTNVEDVFAEHYQAMKRAEDVHKITLAKLVAENGQMRERLGLIPQAPNLYQNIHFQQHIVPAPEKRKVKSAEEQLMSELGGGGIAKKDATKKDGKKDEKKCGKDSKKEVSEKSRSKETVAKEDKAENMVVDKEETTVEKEESAAEKSKVESEDGSGKTGMDVEPAEPSETSKESQQKINKRTVEIMEVELAEKAEEVKENMEIETDAKEDESTQMPTDIPKQDSEEKPPTSLPPAEASTADASTSDDVSKDD